MDDSKVERYQVIYCKYGDPIVAWFNDSDAAHNFAVRFRRVGYSVDVYLHTNVGSRKTNL